MIKTAELTLFLSAAVGFVMVRSVCAVTVQTIGAGSAVSVVERSATFDALTETNTMELGNYTEEGLYITTGNQSWGADPALSVKLDPFHRATASDRGFFCVAWDNPEWTSIQTTNTAVMLSTASRSINASGCICWLRARFVTCKFRRSSGALRSNTPFRVGPHEMISLFSKLCIPAQKTPGPRAL